MRFAGSVCYPLSERKSYKTARKKSCDTRGQPEIINNCLIALQYPYPRVYLSECFVCFIHIYVLGVWCYRVLYPSTETGERLLLCTYLDIRVHTYTPTYVYTYRVFFLYLQSIFFIKTSCESLQRAIGLVKLLNNKNRKGIDE